MTIGYMPQRFVGPLSARERASVLDALRTETVGGVLLIAAAVIALIWANSPWQHSYTHLVEFKFGPSALHLNLTLEQWGSGRSARGVLLRRRCRAQAGTRRRRAA
jgi:hypothetical protein